MLTRMNNEAKVRRLAKTVVLGQGQGKVMSFEDIEVTRTARAAKEDIKGRGKIGRKRKIAALEIDEPEVARMIEVSEPYRAPVAQIFKVQVIENQIAARGIEVIALFSRSNEFLRGRLDAGLKIYSCTVELDFIVFSAQLKGSCN